VSDLQLEAAIGINPNPLCSSFRKISEKPETFRPPLQISTPALGAATVRRSQAVVADIAALFTVNVDLDVGRRCAACDATRLVYVIATIISK